MLSVPRKPHGRLSLRFPPDAYQPVYPHYRLSDKNEVWGTFGDYFGGILNPVIAAFAFYLIAKTYELQKRELEETRKLLKISTDAQNNQVKLAVLTALLNSNLTRITLLESEKLSLLESEFRNPQPTEYKHINTTIRSVLDGTYGEYIKTRKDYVNDEVNVLKTKNIKLEAQIEAFMKE